MNENINEFDLNDIIGKIKVMCPTHKVNFDKEDKFHVAGMYLCLCDDVKKEDDNKDENRRKETQGKLESTNKELARAIAEQAKLESTIQILRKNRKEADEKINNLHDGDALGNALNGLHKHKN